MTKQIEEISEEALEEAKVWLKDLIKMIPAAPPDQEQDKRSIGVCLKALTARDARIAELKKALDWYKEKAEALARTNIFKKPHVAEAIFIEMALDGGKRARSAYTGEK